MDLLVKAYPPRPGGGVGAFLCSLAPGQAAALKVKRGDRGGLEPTTRIYIYTYKVYMFIYF